MREISRREFLGVCASFIGSAIGVEAARRTRILKSLQILVDSRKEPVKLDPEGDSKNSTPAPKPTETPQPKPSSDQTVKTEPKDIKSEPTKVPPATAPQVQKDNSESGVAKEENEVMSIAWMPETVKSWSKDIVAISKEHNVDPKLTAAVILCESGGHPYAISGSGARGLGQIMPTTAPDRNLLVPGKNIDACAGYLASMYKYFGDWTKAITAYNAGPGNVSRGTIPAEGIQYRYWVTNMWNDGARSESSVYKEWLAAGGWVLVDKAEKYWRLDPKVRQAVGFACEHLGDQYLLGGEGPDKWDCARLVYFAYKKAGVNFSGSIAGGKVVTDQWSSCGRTLAKDEEKLPGDLVVFNNASGKLDHVGMMIYPPHCFIEATWTGKRVRVTSLSPNFAPIYRADLAGRVKGFKRIIG